MPPRPVPAPRRVNFDFPDDFDVCWHPRLPEFAYGANAVSLLMPHAEPLVARAVRDVVADLEPELARQATGYVHQETQHHRQHWRFNRLLTDRYPSLRHVDRLLAAVVGFLSRHASPPFALAFAAGFETVAYSSARWTARHRQHLLAGADPTAASLFLWHLAEEVEHKSVAHEVWRAVDGRRWRLIAGTVTAMVLLATAAVLGTLVMLTADRRILNPIAHWRLLTWTLGLTFTVLPDAVASWLPGHDPDTLADPSWYTTWLAEFDETDGSMPLWRASLNT